MYLAHILCSQLGECLDLDSGFAYLSHIQGCLVYHYVACLEGAYVLDLSLELPYLTLLEGSRRSFRQRKEHLAGVNLAHLKVSNVLQLNGDFVQIEARQRCAGSLVDHQLF